MEEKNIPYFAHEGDMARMERANRRLFIVLIILIAALLGTNAGWIYYEAQFQVQEETTTVQQEAEWEEGSNIIMNGTGEVSVNGTSEANNDENDKNENQENRRQ